MDSCLENPMGGRAWQAVVHGVAKSRTRLSDFPFIFHFHALEKEMAPHSSILCWRIPRTGEPGGLPSMGSHRVGHTEATQQQQAVLLQVQLHGITATIPIHKCRVITRLPSCYTPIATSSSLYPCLWESINLFSISVITLFHECCISGVMQHIHFQP